MTFGTMSLTYATTTKDAMKIEVNQNGPPVSFCNVQHNPAITDNTTAVTCTANTAPAIDEKKTATFATCTEGTIELSAPPTPGLDATRASPDNFCLAKVDNAVESNIEVYDATEYSVTNRAGPTTTAECSTMESNTEVYDETPVTAAMNRAGPTANCAENVAECSTVATGAPANLATTDYPNPAMNGSRQTTDYPNPAMNGSRHMTVMKVDEGANQSRAVTATADSWDGTDMWTVEKTWTAIADENATRTNMKAGLPNELVVELTSGILAANSRMKTTIRATDVSKAMANAGGIQDDGAMCCGAQTAGTNVEDGWKLTTEIAADAAMNTVVEETNRAQKPVMTITDDASYAYPNPFNAGTIAA
ncbi:hypothetical protein ACFL0L_00515 [Patescibacteria group bacterium]